MAEKITKINSSLIPLQGDDIDTDRIIPARFLKCITFDGLGEHAFEDDRFDDKGESTGHPFDNEAFKTAGIMVVNKNFGCGSSREHAPQAIKRAGIKAIIGESFAEIFFGNCVALGVPCLTLSREDIKSLQLKAEEKPVLKYDLDIENLKITGEDLSFDLGMPEAIKDLFITGHWDVTGILLANNEKIENLAKTLPYISW